MRIEYLHASKYGNGAMVAEEFDKQLAAKGVTVNVHHIREARPDRLPTADLYLFSSPGRMGKPIGGMRRFLKKLRLPAGTRYAILTTEMAPQPDKKTGRTPTEEELAKWQRVRPIMNEILQGAGLVKVAEDKVHVTGLKGPLEEGWQKKVEAFAAQIPIEMQGADSGEDVPTAVELWWRPEGDQAAASSLVGVTAATAASSATRSAGRCR
jgi:menaquinone-dependent protoporphyrinogen IX oxidase